MVWKAKNIEIWINKQLKMQKTFIVATLLAAVSASKSDQKSVLDLQAVPES